MRGAVGRGTNTRVLGRDVQQQRGQFLQHAEQLNDLKDAVEERSYLNQLRFDPLQT